MGILQPLREPLSETLTDPVRRVLLWPRLENWIREVPLRKDGKQKCDPKPQSFAVQGARIRRVYGLIILILSGWL